MDIVYNWFWSESFWLPAGSTWKDLKNDPKSDIYIAQAKDINWSLPLGFLLLLFRYVFERYLITPLGVRLGVKDKKQVLASSHPVLEKFYKKNGFVNNNSIESVAKQTDMTIRQVEVWLRKRRQQSVPSNIKKFRECSWHLIFYLTAFIYGFVILKDKIWFRDTEYCWKGWPKLHVSNDVYYYYLIELTFYWCLVFSVLTDHRRKDFMEMIIHHIATIVLLYFSWINNFSRIGTLVMLVHDAADVPMAAAKMAKYSGHLKLCECLFALFIGVWIVSRLIIYPFWVLQSSILELYRLLNPFHAFYLFNGLLLVLQILHIIWTYMIIRIAWLKLAHNKVKDVRSETEDSDED